MADYENEKKKIQEELTPASKGVSNLELCVNFAINYSTKVAPVWTSASYTERQRLQFLMFADGLFYDRKKDKSRTDNANDAFQ
ncbi:MAG TPA: hypothetical protein VL307_19890 [Chitinophagaceae bacterium]|nr:hypothetical protein [Chitinophagaceae bacterium]